METTLILLKPDCLTKGHCGDVLKRFENCGFHIRGLKMAALDGKVLAEHYSHIAEMPFFPAVAKFMTSTPIIALALAGDGVVARVRSLCGPTDSTEAAGGTIRGDFGINKMVNVIHASDSIENAQLELQRFFKEGEIFSYEIPAEFIS